MRYRKKPVVIHAVKWTGNLDELKPLFKMSEQTRTSLIQHAPGDILEINTLEGTMAAKVGDWIICGVKGEIYPCKADIFEATYEVAEAKSGLDRIAKIIENVDHRCQFAEGAVTPTLKAMQQEEIQEIYDIARGKR